MQDLQIICTRLYFIAELEEGVCFSFHVKSSMHDRAVTAKAANDRKARNEPSDIDCIEQHNILPNLKDHSLIFQP